MVEEAGLPWLVAHAVSDSISVPLARNIFHGVPTGSANGRAMAQFVLSKPDTARVAIIEHSNDWAHSYSNPARDYLSENGVTPVVELTMERGQTDATAQVLKLREQKPDFIIAAIYEAETAIFLRDLKKYGMGDIPVMGTAGTDLENTLKRVGDFDTVKNYYVIHSYVDNLDGPKLEPVRQILAEYAPDEELSTFSFVSIGSAKALVAALRRSRPDPGQAHRRNGRDRELRNRRAVRADHLERDRPPGRQRLCRGRLCRWQARRAARLEHTLLIHKTQGRRHRAFGPHSGEFRTC